MVNMELYKLINKENRLDKDFIPENLIEYKEYNGEKIDPNAKTLVVAEVLDAFTELQSNAKKDGFGFVIDSCYRTYEYQKKIFDHYVETKGIDYAIKYVAEPGCSEHQSGYAIDVALTRNGIYTDKFTDEDEEIKWLHTNCHKYGFILRYPKGKKDITGYNYECWHIRYVGKEISNYMHENNIETLEEYNQLLTKRR